ncbi:MAG: hypothetical protein K5985_11130 [Lachnospiraceae bacterium]|nr:hypothetical protein [Lachnospiraceae bacterium]
MNLGERLDRKIRRAAAPKSPEDLYYDTEADWMEYAPRKSEGNINENEGAFVRENISGINTARSVFDATAVFRTRREEQ